MKKIIIPLTLLASFCLAGCSSGKTSVTQQQFEKDVNTTFASYIHRDYFRIVLTGTFEGNKSKLESYLSVVWLEKYIEVEPETRMDSFAEYSFYAMRYYFQLTPELVTSFKNSREYTFEYSRTTKNGYSADLKTSNKTITLDWSSELLLTNYKVSEKNKPADIQLSWVYDIVEAN